MNTKEKYSDNAGGGLRGNRAVFTRELAEVLSDEYGFDKSAKYTDFGGSSNLNLYVKTNQTQYVVRVYRPYVTANRIEDILRVRKKLNENNNRPVLKPCVR
jgi:Ser/Thr protein kinase RdoA (MazF antagonist)